MFDVPSMGEKPFEERYAWLKKTFMKKDGSSSISHVKVVEQTSVESRAHVLDLLKATEKEGGEGLMLRKPKSCVAVFNERCASQQ